MDGFLAINAAGQARALACEPDSGPILRALPPVRTFRRRLDRGRSHTARPGPHRCTRVLCLTAVVAVFFRGPHHVGLQRFRAQRDHRRALPQRLQHHHRERSNARTSEPPRVRDLPDVLGGARGARGGGRRIHQGSSRLPGATGRSGGSSGSTEGALTTANRAYRDRRNRNRNELFKHTTALPQPASLRTTLMVNAAAKVSTCRIGGLVYCWNPKMSSRQGSGSTEGCRSRRRCR